MTAAEPEQTTTRLSGRHVVLVMLAFGVGTVAAMAAYWEMYTRPFRGLQTAIAAEYPDAHPRVIGGRQKGRDTNPATLRIVVQVDFDPQADVAHSAELAQRLSEIAFASHDMTPYTVLEIHLYHRIPEDDVVQWSSAKPVEEWREAGN